MAKITLSIKDDDEAGIKALDGKHIFASNGCEEHDTFVIIALPQGKLLDVGCAVRSLEHLARTLINVVEAKGKH